MDIHGHPMNAMVCPMFLEMATDLALFSHVSCSLMQLVTDYILFVDVESAESTTDEPTTTSMLIEFFLFE